MEQKDILLARMDDFAEKAKNTGCAASRFLTPTETRAVEGPFRWRIKKRAEIYQSGVV